MVRKLLQNILMCFIILGTFGAQSVKAQDWTTVWNENFNGLTYGSSFNNGVTGYWNNSANPPQNSQINGAFEANPANNIIAGTTQIPSDAAGGRFLMFWTQGGVSIPTTPLPAANIFFKKTVSVTPGKTYRISFRLATLGPVPAVATNRANATLKVAQQGVSTPFYTSATVVADANSWKNSQYIFVVPASVTSIDLTWENTTKSVTGNDFAIDDLLLEVATDSDADGIPDVNDLDDDNDGILDTVECTPNYLVRPVTSSSVTADKPITVGTAPQIADGEGAGGTGDGPFPYWYTNVPNLPIAFSMNMQSSSTIDHIKLYGPWGFTEWIGNFTIELYNAGNNLLGTENFVAPNQYTGTPIFSFTKEYTNVTRVRFTIVSSQGYSTVIPQRASLNEIVFLDLQPLTCDTDNDGIPNHLDLDSDGDGCPDAREGAGNFNPTTIASGPIAAQTPNTNFGTAVNTTTGVPTAVGAGQSVGQSQDASKNDCLDSDGDGVANWQDLDDDNDGILDTAESVCIATSPLSSTGWKAVVYDATNGLDGWGQVSGSTIFPTAGYTQIANFDYNEFAGTNNAFGIGFSTGTTGLNSTNADITNYTGTTIAGSTTNTNEDYAVLFRKTINYQEIGTYVFNLDYGDDHIFIYKNGNKVAQRQNAYSGTLPVNNFATISVVEGDIISILMVEEGLFNTTVTINATKTAGFCYLNDTDGDGIPNHLDLDSDNDGCVDAIEGGANITNGQLVNSAGTVNVGFGSTASNKNLCDGIICVDANGVPTIVGASGQTVGQSLDAAKNDCLDTDGDGVANWQDLDDDNDGILDAEESPTCFYTVFEANQVAGVLSSLNGAGTDPLAGINIPLLYNDNINDGAVAAAYNFAASQTLTTGLPIFTIKYPTAIAIKSLTVNQAANGMASGGFAKLYGSNDGVNYTLLTVGNGISIASATVTLNNTAVTEYLYYQIRYIGTVAAGNGTSIAAGTTAIHEISSLAASTPVYNPSAHPKPGICGADTDGDTIPNHLDPDSDGDGCSDAYEGGSTSTSSVTVIPGPYGANGLANSLETSSESGVINYISTYRKYAVKATEKLCLDSDNDGVSNPIDLDDDNDGVLDTDEGDFCGKLDRNIRIGYLNTAVGSTGLATNLLYNLNNFSTNGVYNKVRGVTLIPFATAASVTEANLLAQNIDIFYVGSSANDAVTAADKIPTSVNTILTTWAKNNKKGIFALQNNAIDYGYVVTPNNTNPNTPIGVLGRDYYTNGYWPTPSLNQVGGVQMTIKSLTREFEFLMLDANLRPVVITDSEYNLVIFPDATIYINESGNPTPTTNDQKAIADTWSYVFDKYLDTQCTFLDTDGDSTPNHLDLDSDDDGCSDAVEAGATTSNVTNFAFVTNAGTATDSNSDGLADIVDANLNGIPDYLSTYNPEALDDTIKKCSDSDGDGIIDIADLDDDNDGILDTNEGLSCNSLNRNLRIGYLNTTVGTNGLMLNMLNNPVNFSLTGTYNKFPGITFVPYATEASITEAQLLTDNIDVFYVGSSAADTQTTADKLLTATNNRILSWATNNNKGVVVLQNNATDYGYLITNNNVNANIPYGPLGESVFTNGYWPVNTFSQLGTVQMTINSASKNYETAMADAEGKATFIRDRDEKIVFIPDATIFISNQAASNIGTDATLKVAADVWAFAFDTFLDGVSCTTTDLDNDGIPDHLDLDSDGDGCSDAIEGGAAFIASNLVDSSMPGGNSGGGYTGTSTTPVIQNLGNTVGSTPTTIGVPTIAGTGQTVGDSQNGAVSSQCSSACYKPAVLDAGNTFPTKHGITALRAGADNENWPMTRQSAWTVLESKEKGFVVNRVATTSGLANITNPVEGMMVYDEEEDCLKIYTLKTGDTVMAWHCFTTPACPD